MQQKIDSIPKDKRKKILLLSDDLRTLSGIATMSKEIVLGLAHRYNWVQLGAMVKSPEQGKVYDMSAAINQEIGDVDASVKLYPFSGYGNPDVLRELLSIEKPDAIVHFTDPRFWLWLYSIEREIRQYCPIIYYNIWDDLPYPMYNKPYYESCDGLLAITKQTYNINKWVLGPELCKTIDKKIFDATTGIITDVIDDAPTKKILHYCPHGVNTAKYFPIEDDSKLENARKKLFGNKRYKYVMFYNSRNIRRKQTSSILLAFRTFCDNLSREEANECVLVLHTHPVDENGTDLLSCKDALCSKYNVIFSADKVPAEILNEYYNIADVTIHLSDNEGFGIGTCESLSAGTPIIVNVTGGLQDQCGFVDDVGNPIEFTRDWSTNNDGRYKTCGKWAKPVFPGARMIQGSIPTPYIFGDYGKWEDAAQAMYDWYKVGRVERKACGKAGREFILNEGGLNSINMCNQIALGIDATIENWKGRERFNLIKVASNYSLHSMPNGGADIGIKIPQLLKE